MLFTRKQAEAKLGKEHSVRIEVVDNYQGEESDIIILSLVRSLNPEGRIGFLSVDNRVCVAMSRAKKGFYILGNIDFLASKCTLWSNIKRSLEERDSLSTSLTVVCQSHGKEQVISDWRDFDRLTSQGGCHLPCDYRLDCGHACPRLCHPTKHDNVFCAEPCGRSCPIGHPCKKKCYDKCGKCLINVVAVLPCGHSTKKPCHVDIKDVKCSQPCPEALRCGHRCADKCSAPCTTSCKHPVHKILNCGHPKMMACYEDPGNVRCTKKVRKSWFGCGHQVDVECWIDPLKTPCPHPCRMSLPDCGHSCKGTCGKCRQGRLHVRCDEKCSRVLICGHVCGSKCSSTCPPCEQPCETACFHSRCSSVLKSAYEKQKCRKDLHGKTAGRKCGELCPPCLEKCSNQCVHLCKHVDEDHDQYKCSDTKRRICNKLCMEPCAIEPCDERCSKQLKCGHRCLGLCGEDCPPICKECPLESAPRVAYEEATSIVLSGLEDSLDAMFIMLTCGHCIESTAMDHWVQERIDVSREQDTAIVQLECPMCKTLVKKSRRYQKQLNQRISDIETIKKKLIGGTAKELDGKRQENISNIKLLIKEAVDEKASIERRSWDETAVKVMREMMKVKEAQLTKDMVIKYENLVAFAEALFDSLKKVEGIRDKFAGRINVVKLQYHNLKEAAISFFGSENIISALITEWKNLLNFMNRSLFQNLASSLMFEQFRNEVVRLDRWIILGQVFLQANLVGDIREEAFDAVQKLDDLLNGTRESNSESLGAFQNLLKIFNNGVGVSYEERMEIKRALAGVVQSWYKCKNGHLYGIGDCGQAMERSKCPECGAGIGGEYHRIREDNTLDREMTGEQPYERNPFQAIW
uniref:RZ-type domain-containing protein n=1 Tax=Steinernema glaseri TaxID=37863 RepID=A0A1I8A7A0_9BILA